MATIKKILVPIDFSEHSTTALNKAEEFARLSGAELILLHVIDETPFVMVDTAGYVPAREIAQLEAASKQTLDEWRKKSVDRGLTVTCEMVRSSPADGVVSTAKKLGADLIVMGTHGRRGVSHFLLGSVAERVVRTAEVPVMTVRAPAASA